MASPVLQFKRGLLTNLPGLRAGEPGFTNDTYDLYVGIDSTTNNNQFVGSSRFWSLNTTTIGSGVKLVEGTNSGTNSITIKSPDTLASDLTYTMPGTDGSNGQVLSTNGPGTLSFIDAAANLSMAGDSGADTVALLTDTITFAGTANEIETAVTDNQVQIGLPNDVTVGGGLTVTTFTIAGVAVTAILDEDNMASNRANALSTQQSIKAYVDSQVGGVDLTFTTAEGTNGTGGGGGSVATSQTMTFAGTTDEIDVTVSGQSITYGLPNDVTVANNLTVTGNLFVNGSTTQVNTSTTTIEDQLLDLGMVDGAVPSSDLNKDIGVLLNYYSGSAKKAAVYWDDSTSRVVVSADVTETSGVLTNNTGGALEVASLYVSGCTGSTVEVIGCSGGEVVITNATIDGGTF